MKERLPSLLAAPSNTRVQRTRLRSPLTRHPLCGGKSHRGRQPLRLLERLLVAAIFLAAWARTGSACSCVEYLTDPVEALEKSSLVFVGEVLSVSVVTVPVITYFKSDAGEMVPSQYMERKGVVILKAIQEWKGSGSKEYVVLAGAPPVTPLPKGEVVVDCEEHLELGQQYLIFVNQSGFAEVDPCAPTLELRRAKDAIAALDAKAKSK